jgi:hypothetical protein
MALGAIFHESSCTTVPVIGRACARRLLTIMKDAIADPDRIEVIAG